MQILNDYDLMNYVKNVNQPFSPFKLVRNNKANWAKINVPIFAIVNYSFSRDVKKSIGLIAIQLGFIAALETAIFALSGKDPYKSKSEPELKKLVANLQNLNVETDYNLLKKSELDSKKYKFRFNEKKIPELVESKYILVPSYNYNGEIKETALLQEHVVGSNNYILSVGNKQKVLKPVFANNI